MLMKEKKEQKNNKPLSKSNSIIMACLYGMYEAQQDKV